MCPHRTTLDQSLMTWAAGFTLTFMDEFVDSLLTEERVCDIILPRLQKRQILEENGDIGPRKSRLLDAMEGNSEHGSPRGRSSSRSTTSSRSRSDSSKSRGPARYISRSPSRSRSPDSPSRFLSRTPSEASQSPVSTTQPLNVNVMQAD